MTTSSFTAAVRTSEYNRNRSQARGLTAVSMFLLLAAVALIAIALDPLWPPPALDSAAQTVPH